MPMVRAMRLLNAIEAGTLAGSELETLLTNDAGRLAELNVLMGMRGQARRMAASSTAMTAMAASAKAVIAIASSRVAMDEVAKSKTAVEIVASAFVSSATARLAMWNSDAWMAAIQGNTVAMTAMLGAATAVSTSTAASEYTFVAQGTKVILLRRWYGNPGESEGLKWTRTGGNLPGWNATAIKYGPAYENLGNGPTSDDATGNNARACNGLARGLWTGGYTLYVRYLPV